MNNYLLRLSILILTLGCWLPGKAVPAFPGILTITTADGDKLKVRIIGDEHFSLYKSEDGYPLEEIDGNFYFADISTTGEIINSGIKARNIESRDDEAIAYLSTIDMTDMNHRIENLARINAIKKFPSERSSYPSHFSASQISNNGDDELIPNERGYGLFPDACFPSIGDQKALVVLVEYADVKFDDRYDPHDYFSRMLNEDGFSDLGGTGSAAEYFRLNSNNMFKPVFDVYGPISLKYEQAYYGGNLFTYNDMHAPEMIIEACDILEPEIDFTEYDRNNDGYVDNIFVIYAGAGEATGGGPDTVWPHSWNLNESGYREMWVDDVCVNNYGCTNEWSVFDRPDGVGTFIHEFSHVLGLPDLYATSYNGAFTPGEWSALDFGPYNNNGCTPPLYGAFERYALGWTTPIEMTAGESITLPPVIENEFIIIPTPKDSEYFLLENRQQTGWDEFIPGHGMLIWHVDYDNDVWGTNTVNNNPGHQYCDIEEADRIQSEDTRDGDAFPGAAGITTFSAKTRPAMKTWDKVALDFVISNIREEDGMIIFDVTNSGQSGVSDAVMASEGITCKGREISIASNDVLIVYDMSGVEIARGSKTVTVPSKGLYLVRIPARNLTTKVRID